MTPAEPLTAGIPVPPGVDLAQVTQDVWTLVLSVGLGPTDDEDVPFPRIEGLVLISGAWEGAVLLSCSEGFALHAARTMFETDDLPEEDVFDALGELTNMIGGAVKALLNGETHLSIPTVARRSTPQPPIGGAVCARLISFRSAAEPVAVSLWHS